LLTASVGDELEHPIAGVYMLLMGLAVENLAKGVIVAKGVSSPSADGRLARELKSHDLLDLLDMAEVELSTEDAYLVERLQASVEWAGRYPTAVRVESQMPRTHPRGGGGPLNMRSSADAAAIDALVTRLLDESESPRISSPRVEADDSATEPER
jgi:hypothetical protein